MHKGFVIGAVGAFFNAFVVRIICIMLSAALASQMQTILRRIRQKRHFGVFIARIA